MKHPMPKGYRITTQFSVAHPGTDYAPPTPGQIDCPCYAPEKSIVVVSSTGLVEGQYVILQGMDTKKFYYFGHFSSRKVTTGQSVVEGAVIGILGKTGTATGIHTHCEVRNERNSTFAGKTNPEVWFNSHIGVDDMYDGKTAKEWYLIANDWHVRADDRQKVIVRLENEVQDLKKRVADLEASPAQQKLDQIKGIINA